MSFRAVLVDDEPLALQRLRKLLGAHPEIEIVGTAGDGEEAVERIRALSPDVVFLDIQLPPFDGFEVLRRLKSAPLVIFVTAHDEYALRAFEATSVDYLLKPVEPEKLERALAKLRRLSGGSEKRAIQERLERLLAYLEENAPRDAYLQKLGIRVGERTLVVGLDEVSHFYSEDKYVFAHILNGKDYIVEYTLAELEQRLDPRRFVRIHRATLVNAEQIREIQKWFGGKYRVLLRDPQTTVLLASKTMAGNLRRVVPF